MLATYLYSPPAIEVTRLFISPHAVSYKTNSSRCKSFNIFQFLSLFHTFPYSYCVGCPENVFNTVRREEIGDVVIINCDTNYVENPFHDVAEMPLDIVNYLKKHLNNSSTDLRGNFICYLLVFFFIKYLPPI